MRHWAGIGAYPIGVALDTLLPAPEIVRVRSVHAHTLSVMTLQSRILCGFAAAAAALAAAFQFLEGETLRGANGLAIAAVLGLLATGLPDRSRAARWTSYALMGLAFLLLGVRLLARYDILIALG